MGNTKVLIVEDESILALTLMRIIEKEGYEVACIIDYAEEVMEAIQKHQPNLILMDIFLKGPMNGVEVTKEINEKYQLPVIYITGNSDESTYEAAMITEPFAYMEKPIHRSELIAFMADALTRDK
jgi:DNA-binding NtrC family response regulator